MPIHGYPGNVITANPTAPTSSVASGVWTTEQQLIAKAAGNWPFTIPIQQISRSLRFNSADSAYLNRTLSSGNQKTWTWSAWIKRTSLTDSDLFTAKFTGGSYPNAALSFDANVLRFWSYTGSAFRCNKYTTQVFRDVSAWYHLVIVADTTNATAEDRFKMYVNGVRITAFSTNTNPSLNDDLYINGNTNHAIGGYAAGGYGYFNGYITEVNFIDGQALTPSSFGRNNIDTGVWEPLAYTGTYGTNGFYLNFSDNSNTTAATLGKDYSGNGNNWTPNNFSVTAGAGNDSLVDSPTAYGTDTGVGGEVRGNYATLNPLARNSGTLANGNLDFSTGATYQYGSGTIAIPSSGKWIFEVTFNTTPTTNNYNSCGVVTSSFDRTGSFTSTGAYGVEDVSTFGQRFVQNGVPQGSITMPSGTVIQCLIDRDAGTLTFTKNGTLQTGTGSTVTLPASSVELFAVVGQYSNSVTANFGQRAFAYTAPSGFKALCTTNLPTPTIGATSTTQAGKYFNPVLYTGNGTSSRSITGVGFAPDFVWVKNRSGANSHGLYDTIRGATKSLYSNSTSAEQTDVNSLTAFGSDGFTVGTDGIVNTNTSSYVSWNWNAGGSNATNTAGNITSTVRANTTSGFSIVTYTGTGSNATVGHGLGVAPTFIIVKQRNTTRSWPCLVKAANSGNGQNGRLNLDETASYADNIEFWNNTTPTSTVFSVGISAGTNQSSGTYVAYCFAPVAGYSAFGSYTGNAAADGPFIYTGFRPEFVIIKASSSTGDWVMEDVARSPYNVSTNYLLANSSGAETTGQLVDFLSNGFKIRVAVSSAMNGSGTTYVYAAFAESPFKYALAR